MNIKSLLIGLPVAALLFGSAQASQQSEFKVAFMAAKTAQAAAHMVGDEWRDTGKLIKKAKADAAKGDYTAGIKMANKAEFQGLMAQRQAASQVDAGNPSYLY